MMNVFGQGLKRGPPGPPGPQGDEGPPGKKGDSATDIAYWFPKLTVSWWRKGETCSFYFDDADKDGVIFDETKGKITHLRNKSADRLHAKALRIVRKREKESTNGYSLLFDKSLYFIENVTLACFLPSFSCLFISFKVSEFPKTRQYLVTSPKLEHALTIERNKIQVWNHTCLKPTELEYRSNFWTIVFVQWVTGRNSRTGYFSVDSPSQHTTFETKNSNKEITGIYIGGIPSKKEEAYFSGKICCIDLYDSVYSGTLSEPLILPKQMQTAVMRNHESLFIN